MIGQGPPKGLRCRKERNVPSPLKRQERRAAFPRRAHRIIPAHQTGNVCVQKARDIHPPIAQSHEPIDQRRIGNGLDARPPGHREIRGHVGPHQAAEVLQDSFTSNRQGRDHAIKHPRSPAPRRRAEVGDGADAQQRKTTRPGGVRAGLQGKKAPKRPGDHGCPVGKIRKRPFERTRLKQRVSI